MEYRNLGSTGLRVGVIGMGCEGFMGDSFQEFEKKLDWLCGHGVNFLDMYTPDPSFRANVKATFLHGRPRTSLILQGHLCSVWEDGQYLRTRDIAKVRAGFETQLAELGTDYLDIGMIHYVDSLDDWKAIAEGPVMDFAKELKAAGRIHHIGLSSHNPEVASAAVESGDVEVLLFSINPCYDMQPAYEDIEENWAPENYAHDLHDQDSERRALYELAEARGVGIDCMKVFGGGDLLDEKLSPFGRAFTSAQCIHYALTRPAVSSVMLGCKTLPQWEDALAYLAATDEQRDYSGVLSGMDRFTFAGHCMYCGHCAPCSVGISVADVTKYLNLALAEGEVRETVRGHYTLLPHHASECIECGACETRCPFGVGIIKNMRAAAQLFGY